MPASTNIASDVFATVILMIPLIQVWRVRSVWKTLVDVSSTNVSVSIRYTAAVEPGKDSENLTIDAISLAVDLKNRTRLFPRYSVFMPMTPFDPGMAPYEPTGEVSLKLDVQGGNYKDRHVLRMSDPSDPSCVIAAFCLSLAWISSSILEDEAVKSNEVMGSRFQWQV